LKKCLRNISPGGIFSETYFNHNQAGISTIRIFIRLYIMDRDFSKLTLGFSPCPNDTFIFDAMVHGKIDTEGIEFEVFMEDVEALNQRAFAGDIDITKLSYHAFAHLTHHFALLNAGSALGNNCGPLLISGNIMTRDEITGARIAIPGKMTTANFLLGLAYPEAINKQTFLFSDIEDAVLRGDADAGLIIHENRFTYEQKGLVKIMDLGEFWESATGYPIPLGGIVVNRNIPHDVQKKINRIMRRSVEYAFNNRENVMPFVRCYAQAMEDDVMMSHIGLYVNDFTIDLGDEGKGAVQYMMDVAVEKGLIQKVNDNLFIS
jgi:1,4-dihydroxy-6-naphthoate synthase